MIAPYDFTYSRRDAVLFVMCCKVVCEASLMNMILVFLFPTELSLFMAYNVAGAATRLILLV